MNERRTGAEKNGIIIVLWGLMIAMTGCRTPVANLERHEYSRRLMGTKATVVLYAVDADHARSSARAAFTRMAGLEAVMSDYRDDSELSRLGDRSGGSPIPVSNDLFTVLAHALHFAEVSDGAFDPTVGSLVRLWRQSRQSGELPDETLLAIARGRVGHHLVELDPARRTVRLAVPDMRLDLGGIGKGFAADAAHDVLDSLGVPIHLIDIGGDLVLGDAPPNSDGWRIGLGADDITKMTTLENVAVATSGDAEQFVEIDGVRYSHIVDPRTGLGLTNSRAVTVVAATGTEADAMASASSIAGPSFAKRLVRERRAIRAVWIGDEAVTRP